MRKKLFYKLVVLLFVLSLVFGSLVSLSLFQQHEAEVVNASKTEISKTSLPYPPINSTEYNCQSDWLAYYTYIKPEYLQALQPQYRQIETLPKTPPLYKLNFKADLATHTYQGHAEITFWNNSPESMPFIVVRDYANFFHSVGGAVLYKNAQINGEVVTLQNKALTYTAIIPKQPISSCAKVQLNIDFEGKIPDSLSEIAYANGSFYVGQSVLAMANFYPQLAIWEKPADHKTWDWTMTPVSASSDLTAAESAFYDIRVQVNSSYQILASGVEIENKHSEANFTTWHFVGGPIREFALVGSDHFSAPQTKTLTQHTQTTVNVYTLTSNDPLATARQKDFTQKALDISAATLDDFSQLLEPYPYVFYNLIEFPLVGFNGLEWPLFSQISTSLFQRDYTGQEQNFEGLIYSKPGTLVVVHETIHQWWYNLVGNDQQAEPFLDEGLTEYCTYLLPELHARYNNGSIPAAQLFSKQWLDKLREQVAITDLPVNTPANKVTLAQAAYLYYRKAPLMYEEYRAKLGELNFLLILKNFVSKNFFGFVHFKAVEKSLE